jgi:LPS-assembly lipoprotein
MYKIFTNLFVLLVIIIMSGCGFHLRGQTSLPSYLLEPYVKGNDRELGERLESELISRGASPLTDASDASSIIELLQVSYLREVGALDTHGKVRGYVLKYEVVYRVVEPDLNVVVDQTRLTLSRNLDYDLGEILQLQHDEELLRREIIDEVVKRIIMRLTTVSGKD